MERNRLPPREHTKAETTASSGHCLDVCRLADGERRRLDHPTQGWLDYTVHVFTNLALDHFSNRLAREVQPAGWWQWSAENRAANRENISTSRRDAVKVTRVWLRLYVAARGCRCSVQRAVLLCSFVAHIRLISKKFAARIISKRVAWSTLTNSASHPVIGSDFCESSSCGGSSLWYVQYSITLLRMAELTYQQYRRVWPKDCQ